MKLSKESFIEAYERLRSEVLNNQTGSNSGLALLMRKGIFYWMESCSNCLENSRQAQQVKLSSDLPAFNPELVAILSMMVMYSGREVVNHG